ncbi:MAG: tyrosine-type recombinase/integrase [Gemmatimonadota bacterium]
MLGALNRIAGLDGSTAETFAWHELRYDDVRAIPARLRDEGLSSKTINKLLSALRGVLETAWRLGTIPDEEYRKIIIKNEAGKGEPAGHALQPAELDRIEVILRETSLREAAIIAVLVGAGLRRIEVARLRREDYDPTTGRLSAFGKGNKRRSVPVGTRWRPFIDAWWKTLAPDASMFETAERQVSYIVAGFYIKHGLQKFTPHDFRRTFATHICKVSDIAVAQRLLGHENIQTTTIYDKRGEDVEDEAVKNL